MTALIRPGHYINEAQASWSFWEVRCGCCRYGAERLQRFQPWTECRFCGQVTEVIWPPEKMVHGIERLLMMRPDPTTRNWRPGESLHDLMLENGAHGVLDRFADLEVTPGDSLFTVNDFGIQHDALPMIKPRIRQEITP